MLFSFDFGMLDEIVDTPIRRYTNEEIYKMVESKGYREVEEIIGEENYWFYLKEIAHAYRCSTNSKMFGD